MALSTNEVRLRLVAAPARRRPRLDDALSGSVTLARQLGEISDAAMATIAGAAPEKIRAARPQAAALKRAAIRLLGLYGSGRLTADSAAEALKLAYRRLSGLQGLLPEGRWFASSARRIEKAMAEAVGLAEGLGGNMAVDIGLHEGGSRRSPGRRPELRLV